MPVLLQRDDVGHHTLMSRLPQTLPPEAEVLHAWVLDSFIELKNLRRSISSILYGPDSEGDSLIWDVPERMVLVATEFATNAIRHGLAPTEVRLLRAGEMFLLDVSDYDLDTAPAPTDAAEGELGGRGLAIAQSLALDIGWYRTPSTKHVWATFTRPVIAGRSTE